MTPIPATASPSSHAMEGRYYTDEAIHRAEKDRIFYRTWQYACHEGEIPSIGDFVVFEVADESLFVIRHADDELRCFYNVCQHRAHQLLAGRGNRRIVSCPYHAWSYGLDGRLRSAPNSENVPDFDRDSVCLTPVRLERFCGFVFVNLDPNAQPMASWYGDAEAALRTAVPEIDRYRPIWTHDAHEDCNWKVAVENYNECYHCKVVHHAFTKGVVDPSTVDIRPNGYTLRHSARAVISGSYRFDDDVYRVIYLWPAMSIQIYPGKVVNTYWWRVTGTETTRVHRGWLALDGAQDAETLRIAHIDRETTFAEDLPLIESVQRGLHSRGYRPGPLVLDPGGGVDNELSVAILQSWVREALDGAPDV